MPINFPFAHYQMARVTGWQPKPISGRILYVDGQRYLKGFKCYKPYFEKMADAFKELKQGDTILVYGKVDESNLFATDRTVTDVTICGMGTRTRPGHGDESAMAGSADWSAEKDNDTDPLFTIAGQGWSIRNIHFGGGKNAPTVRIRRTTDWNASGSHAEFRNVAFSGGFYGIEDYGGCTNVGVFDCQFYGYKLPGATAIRCSPAPLGVALPLMWEISGNRFINNDQHIDAELSNSIICGNRFFKEGFDIPNHVSIDLTSGKNNIVDHNQFGHLSNEPGYVNGAYKSAPGDAWGPNYCSDREVYGVPTE